jgi:hypothetical protein
MSQEQINATALLCWLLERNDMEISASTLRVGERKSAAELLLQERMLVSGHILDWITCPECWIESARVVRETSPEQILLFCPECEDFEVPRYYRETHQVPLQKFIHRLLNGLHLSINGMKVIEPDLVWRLGTTEEKRGKALTWYFARWLRQPEIAYRLREQIMLEKTAQSCRILTSSELPLPVGSPVTGMDVSNLASLARISQSKFEFFADRLHLPGPQMIEEAAPGTTLRYVESQSKVFIEGQAYDLEPRQQFILLALIRDLDHEMDKSSLKSASGSQAQLFSPSKEFIRNRIVYRTFIRYLRSDERYALNIYDEDRQWLNSVQSR